MSRAVIQEMFGGPEVVEAGDAYPPVDLGLPAGRIAFMLADAGARCALTVSAAAAAVRAVGPVPVVTLL
jgi:non-ribosomal peptide synthetase component F